MSKINWDDTTPVCIGHNNSIELFPITDGVLSLAVISYRDKELCDVKKITGLDSILNMQANTHLTDDDIKDLIVYLLDYLEYRKGK